MIIKIIIILIVVTLCVMALKFIEKDNKYDKISFKETMDLLNLPIISFTCNGYKLHFLLDSGSSHSHVTSNAIYEINEHKSLIDSNIKTAGIGGVMESSKVCTLKLGYKNTIYESNFIVSTQLAQQMSIIKERYNINIHGILGGDFLSKYDYVMDFKDLVAYSKK